MLAERVPVMTTPGEGVGGRADRRRNDEAIARAAARLLAADPTASVQAIAVAAGVSRPTVYRRFPTREALETAVRTFTIRSVSEVLDAFDRRPEGNASLRLLLEQLLEVGRAYPMALSRHRLTSTPGPVDQRMIALLEEGQRAGRLRADLAPAYLNAVVLGILGAACDVASPEDPLPADAVVDMVVRAIRDDGTAAPQGD